MTDTDKSVAANVSGAEIARFDRLAGRWWDPNGPMRPLHRMNQLRVGWIDQRLPQNSNLLDIGCGAGIAAEALAAIGHHVLGMDAAGQAIDAARSHAPLGLPLTYRAGSAEELVDEANRFDAITALEVIEHVPDPAAFLATLASLLNPGGRLFVSTLNRTPRSLAMAKIGAEYILRLLPIGTHDWRRFIRPEELAAHARQAGLTLLDLAGMTMSPLGGAWRESRDLTVNYIAAFQAPG